MRRRKILFLVSILFVFHVDVVAASSKVHSLLESKSIRVQFSHLSGGLALTSFFDKQSLTEIIPYSWGSFFWVWLKDSSGNETSALSSEGWERVDVVRDSSSEIKLRFREHKNVLLKGLAVTVKVVLAGQFAKWTANIDVASNHQLLRVEFPVITAGPLGDAADDVVHYPKASGIVSEKPYEKINYFGQYPHGFLATYQLLGLYDPSTNFYMAAHDPTASVKNFWVNSLSPLIKFSIVWPARNQHEKGVGLEINHPIVTGAIEGDWYDAAKVYQAWVKDHTTWWGKNRPPTRLNDVTIWALGGHGQATDQVLEFAEYMDVPVGVHWYNWHQIPFDDDYPNYFPAKPNFKSDVAKLQNQNVVVMPYVNGRLWDTDLDSFQKVAKPASVKNEQLRFVTEEYGSGQKLAPMCPSTATWQTTLRSITRRLISEFGVDGIYMDQVAAAPPFACMDPTHKHKPGLGGWWVRKGYAPLLENLRQDFSQQNFLTSECNAEVYGEHLDGFLSWHFQFQDQQPIFATIYSPVKTMFGRANKASPTPGVALRARSGQAFVFGEQLGWIFPTIIEDDPLSASFLRTLAKTRHKYRSYIERGQLERPVKVHGSIPTVTSDWAWGKNWNVTISALQHGRWKRADGKEILLLVNVDHEKAICFRVAEAGTKLFTLDPLAVQVLEL